MKKILAVAALATCITSFTNNAMAHAISIGFENAGPGMVNIWLGTYEHGGHHLEGGLQLEGVSGTVFGPVMNAFTMLTGSGVGFKPAGLIDGTTNYYVSGPVGGSGPLVGSEAAFNAECPACGPVNHWEGVTFSGLLAGDYKFTYVPIGAPSQEWEPWNDNLNGIFNLAGVVQPTVPEPGSVALFGIAFAGLVAARRRKVR
jgi:hypothetical protein